MSLELLRCAPVFSGHDQELTSMYEDRIVACLLGTALGDSIGLPYEGLSRRRAARLLGEPDRHRLLFGRGMLSDDTEHSCMVVQALIESGGEPEPFQRALAVRLRWWVLALPAGVGFATLRAALKLWLGFKPSRSGVFSAGNGPAMRMAVLGVAVDEEVRLRKLVTACTNLTHTDPKAEKSAWVVALAAHLEARASVDRPTLNPFAFIERLRGDFGDEDELVSRLESVVESVQQGQSTLDYAARVGLECGVTGYAYHTVPVALHAWLSQPRDARATITAAVACGGDTDTVAAIAGGLAGASAGSVGLPQEWLEGLIEWPRTVEWMEGLGACLARAKPGVKSRPPELSLLAIVVRNLLFIVVVLAHGLRRLAPPYR